MVRRRKQQTKYLKDLNGNMVSSMQQHIENKPVCLCYNVANIWYTYVKLVKL